MDLGSKAWWDVYQGCTMASTLDRPPMEADALFNHLATLHQTVLPVHDPGPAPWHEKTRRSWFALPERKT